MGLARQIRRLRKAKELIAHRKRRKALMEPLEPRLLLDADLSFTATGEVKDLSLNLDQVDGVDMVQILNNEDAAPSTQVIDMAVADPYLEPFGSLVHTASTHNDFMAQGETDSFSINTALRPGRLLG